MEKTTKRGRPPKPAEEKRSAVLFIKMTPAEHATIFAAGGSEPSVWARGVLLRAAKRRA